MPAKRRRDRGARGERAPNGVAARAARSARARHKRRGIRAGATEIWRAALVLGVGLLAAAVADRAATDRSLRAVAGGSIPTFAQLPALRACAASRWFDKLPGAVRDPNSRCAGIAEVGFAATPPRARGTASATAPRIVPWTATSGVVLELARQDDGPACTLDATAAGGCAATRRSLAF